MSRDSKFEYLKIVSMLMIVCHHLIAKNACNVDIEIIGLSATKLALQFIGNNAFIANNLFFMVSAWFLSDYTVDLHPGRTWKRVWKLEKVMLFYSILIPVFFYVLSKTGNNQFSEIGGVICCQSNIYFH